MRVFSRALLFLAGVGSRHRVQHYFMCIGLVLLRSWLHRMDDHSRARLLFGRALVGAHVINAAVRIANASIAGADTCTDHMAPLAFKCFKVFDVFLYLAVQLMGLETGHVVVSAATVMVMAALTPGVMNSIVENKSVA